MIVYLSLAIIVAIFVKSPIKALIITIVCYPTLIMFNIGRFSFMFLISLMYFIVLYQKRNRITICPFYTGITIMFSSYFCTTLFCPSGLHITPFLNSLHIFILPLALSVLYEGTNEQRIFFIKTFCIYLCALSVYGVFETIEASNPFIHYLLSHKMITAEQGEGYIRYGMYRSQSFTIWCSVYGVSCGFGLVYLLHQYFNKNLKGTIFVFTLFILLIMGVVISGTRSVMVTVAIAMFGLCGYVFKSLKRIIPVIVVLCLLVVIFQDIFNEIVESITKTDEFSGSSFDMREMQYAAAYAIFSQNPIFGNGLGFVSTATQKSAELLGAESIIFKLMIERGLIGVLTALFMVVQGAYALVKLKNYSLLFFYLAYVCGKNLSLFPSLEETFVLFYIIPLIKEFELSSNNENYDYSQRLIQ